MVFLKTYFDYIAHLEVVMFFWLCYFLDFPLYIS